jgi:DNA polymerase-3 subunit chi
VHRPHPAEAEIADELAEIRPDLLSRYANRLPGARAAVLTRLWRALAHEPLPWITGRERGRDGLTLRLRDGRRLHGPGADPYATGAYVTVVHLDGTAYDHPARLMTALAVPHGDDFAAELAHSVASLALSRAGAEPLSEEWPLSDWEWEQRVVDGHPYHPNCRSRPGFSAAEQLAYGPEHRPIVQLGTVPVRASDCLVTGEWPDELRDGGQLLLPVHPWQTAHVLKRGGGGERAGGPDVVGGQWAGGPGIRDGGIAAHPLMSLRTLAVPGGLHVKTALSARLTSSVRDISVYSVGLSALLSSFAESLAARADGLLHVTRTLGAAAAGTPDLAAVLRESPQTYAATGRGERVVPVAALATTGLPESPAWLADFTRLTLTVGLRLLELGVALEAHGQNLLVVLSPTGAPLRLVYRDLADIRVSPARLTRHGIPVPELTGRIVTDDETALRRKLFGSLVAGALAATAGSAQALGTALEAAVRDLPRTPDLAALVEGPLPAKALTLMRMSPGTPGDQWARLPNPLAPHPRFGARRI